MKKYLILYSTQDGQTRKIAHFISGIFGEDLTDVKSLQDLSSDFNFSNYEKVVIGAAIRYGHFHKTLYKFIKKNEKALEKQDAAFYCVNLTARKEGKDTPEGSSYIQTFLKKSPWQPSLIGVFAGALLYPRYRWFDKFMIRLIMSLTNGETDTTKEIEYTNWDKVKEFALQINPKI